MSKKERIAVGVVVFIALILAVLGFVELVGIDIPVTPTPTP